VAFVEDTLLRLRIRGPLQSRAPHDEQKGDGHAPMGPAVCACAHPRRRHAGIC
jgi:hypothetical protein